jgi:hypothetical protein
LVRTIYIFNYLLISFFFSVYSAAIQEANNVLYDGLIEELVEVLNVRDPTLTVCLPQTIDVANLSAFFIG